uniref:G protein-coupled receptor 157 n=1 Tax=Monodelphis domestica TaxID=13616 RepID=F7DVV1_MONDO
MLLPQKPAPPTEIYPSEKIVVLLSCVLSFLGSSLLIGTHALWPDLRSRARQLLLFLSLADLLSAASYFYGVLQDFPDTTWDCVVQGALSTFANTSSFFWTVAIAVYLYITIVRSSQGPWAGTRLLYCFHVVSWGVPLAITVAAVALKKIGYDASDVSVGWCWINIEAEDRLLWMLLAGKFWELLAYLVLPLLYILIRKHICRAVSPYPGPGWCPGASVHTHLGSQGSGASAFFFSLSLALSTAPSDIPLVPWQGIGNTFQGGANCIMFVLCTQAVRARFCSLCCCCCQCLSRSGENPGDPYWSPSLSRTGESPPSK